MLSHCCFHRNRQCLLVIFDHEFAYQATFLFPLKVSLEYLPLYKGCPFEYFRYLYPKYSDLVMKIKKKLKKASEELDAAILTDQ